MNAPANVSMLSADYDRQKFLGGSDVAAIYGVSPWKTPYDLWVDKTTPRTGEEDKSDDRRKFFARRKRQEPVIAEMLADEYGIEVTRLSLDDNPNRYRDEEHPFMAAEIDGECLMTDALREHFADRQDFCAIPNGTLLNLEFKTVHPFKASEWGEQGSEEVPIHYAAQVMHGLGVTRRPAALVAALFGLDVLLVFPVMRDDETITAMREKAVAFWNDHVLRMIPPAPVNTSDVKKMYAGINGTPAELSDEANSALAEIDVVRGRIKVLTADLVELEWRVARSIAFAWGAPMPERDSPDVPQKENAVLMYGGVKVGTWNRQRGSYLDQKRLSQDQPDLVRQYTVEHHNRVMRFKKEKSK